MTSPAPTAPRHPPDRDVGYRTKGRRRRRRRVRTNSTGRSIDVGARSRSPPLLRSPALHLTGCCSILRGRWRVTEQVCMHACITGAHYPAFTFDFFFKWRKPTALLRPGTHWAPPVRSPGISLSLFSSALDLGHGPFTCCRHTGTTPYVPHTPIPYVCVLRSGWSSIDTWMYHDRLSPILPQWA